MDKVLENKSENVATLDYSPLSNLLEKIKIFAEKHYTRDDVHGWGHVLRVLENARRIHLREGGAWPVIEALVWLHDVGRKQEDEKGENRHHAEISAIIAAQYLQDQHIPAIQIETIVDGIRAHSFSIGGEPKTIEAKILSDADKLDAVGAVGIYRACLYQYQHHQGIPDVLRHFEDKLLTLHEKMHFKSSRLLAIERIARLSEFKNQIVDEIGPEAFQKSAAIR